MGSGGEVKIGDAERASGLKAESPLDRAATVISEANRKTCGSELFADAALPEGQGAAGRARSYWLFLPPDLGHKFNDDLLGMIRRRCGDAEAIRQTLFHRPRCDGVLWMALDVGASWQVGRTARDAIVSGGTDARAGARSGGDSACWGGSEGGPEGQGGVTLGSRVARSAAGLLHPGKEVRLRQCCDGAHEGGAGDGRRSTVTTEGMAGTMAPLAYCGARKLGVAKQENFCIFP